MTRVVEGSETMALLATDAVAMSELGYRAASDATHSISISIFGSGSA